MAQDPGRNLNACEAREEAAVRPLWTESRLISLGKHPSGLESLPGDDWVFRGHERTEWELQTTLERTFGPVKRFDEEDLLLRFVRRAPRFLPSNLVPADDDHAAWLGLLQHYGGPTRLLDVSLLAVCRALLRFRVGR